MKFKFIFLLTMYWFLNICSDPSVLGVVDIGKQFENEKLKASAADLAKINELFIGDWMLINEKVNKENKKIEDCTNDNIISLKAGSIMTISEGIKKCKNFSTNNGSWNVVTNSNSTYKINIKHNYLNIINGIVSISSITGNPNLTITYTIKNEEIIGTYMKKTPFIGTWKLGSVKKGGTIIPNTCEYNDQLSINSCYMEKKDMDVKCSPLSNFLIDYDNFTLTTNSYTFTEIKINKDLEPNKSFKDIKNITIVSDDFTQTLWKSFKLNYNIGNIKYEETYQK